jgi:hypothetical protein
MATDPFARLPVELVLPIVKMLPNLRSLYALVKASPAVAAVFRTSGAEILNCIMSRNLPTSTHQVIYALILLRSRSPPADTWDDFEQKYLVRQWQVPSEYYLAIPKDCSPAILWQVIELAYRIDYLAVCCLDQMLAKTMELRPSLVDEQGLEMLYRWKKAPWKAMPSGKKFTPRLSTRLSWSERQRAVRALWRLQFLYDLKHADFGSWLPWPEGDIDKLKTLELDELLLPLGGYWEDVKSVEEYVTQLDPLPVEHGAPTYRLPPPPIWATFDWLSERLAPDGEEPESYTGLLTESPGPRSVTLVRSRPRTAAPFLRFDMFRHLGFAFWDAERFTDLKLNAFKLEEELGLRFMSHLGYTWRSILPEDVLAEGLRAAEEEDKRKQLERLRSMGLTPA